MRAAPFLLLLAALMSASPARSEALPAPRFAPEPPRPNFKPEPKPPEPAPAEPAPPPPPGEGWQWDRARRTWFRILPQPLPHATPRVVPQPLPARPAPPPPLQFWPAPQFPAYCPPGGT